MNSRLVCLAASALLAACSAKQPAPASNDSKEVSVNRAAAGAVMNRVAATDPRQAALQGLPISTPTPVAIKMTTLPTAYQGKWGLTPADCDISRADSRGLMRVSGNKLDLYDSTGKVLALQKGRGGSVTVDLDFTGAGQNWAAQNMLALAMGGTHLVRTDMSAHKTIRYQRC